MEKIGEIEITAWKKWRLKTRRWWGRKRKSEGGGSEEADLDGARDAKTYGRWLKNDKKRGKDERFKDI